MTQKEDVKNVIVQVVIKHVLKANSSSKRCHLCVCSLWQLLFDCVELSELEGKRGERGVSGSTWHTPMFHFSLMHVSCCLQCPGLALNHQITNGEVGRNVMYGR